MYYVKSPFLISRLSGNSVVWNIPVNKKNEIYLTFDDGPIPEVTYEVLKILAQYNAKATFFCVGENVQKHSEVYKSILNAGHSVGNHTFNHISGWTTLSKKYFANIQKCDDLLHTRLFRPPYGKIRPLQVLKLKKKYSIILWSVLSGDFDKKISPEKCLDNVIKYTKNGSIVVFHDSLKAKKNMLYALPKFLHHYSEKGYEFKALA
ncbi:MAG: polysaccharide deacetylase family protein [Bacteroidales bacterium]|jgi:peptidoglycan/xylan/chitin deacetylase (PgdA/CDA1 family)